MKRTIMCTASIALMAVAMVACKAPKPEQTIANLKAAITGETGASTKYAAFSAKAAEEGLLNIAKMFAATSKAEQIHVANHQAVLAQYGESFEPTVEAVIADSTIMNLQSGIEGETYEFEQMYPGFLTIAQSDKVSGAVTSFTWAMDAEKGHAALYGQVKSMLEETGSDSTVSATWYICPKCGNVYSSIDGVESCALCATGVSNFIEM